MYRKSLAGRSKKGRPSGQSMPGGPRRKKARGRAARGSKKTGRDRNLAPTCWICRRSPRREGRTYCGLCEQLRDRLAAVSNLPGAVQLVFPEREHLVRTLSRRIARQYTPGIRNYYTFRFPVSYFDLSEPEEIYLLFSPENSILTESFGTHLQARRRRKDRTPRDLSDFEAWKSRKIGAPGKHKTKSKGKRT